MGINLGPPPRVITGRMQRSFKKELDLDEEVAKALYHEFGYTTEEVEEMTGIKLQEIGTDLHYEDGRAILQIYVAGRSCPTGDRGTK